VEAVKISQKFQVVIPCKIRESLYLSPGQKIQVIPYGNRIELIPARPISEMRGLLKRITSRVEREPNTVAAHPFATFSDRPSSPFPWVAILS